VIKKPQYRGGQGSTWAVVPWEKILRIDGDYFLRQHLPVDLQWRSVVFFEGQAESLNVM
jgi:hypothetical protein